MMAVWLLCDRLKQERQRAREERIRHTNEQIARIKQRQRETEQQQERWNQLQPYILTAASVVVALLGYFVYQYFTWCVVDQSAANCPPAVTYYISELMLYCKLNGIWHTCISATHIHWSYCHFMSVSTLHFRLLIRYGLWSVSFKHSVIDQ